MPNDTLAAKPEMFLRMKSAQRSARAAYLADLIAPLDPLSRLDFDLAQMAVQRGDSSAVVDLDRIAVIIVVRG